MITWKDPRRHLSSGNSLVSQLLFRDALSASIHLWRKVVPVESTLECYCMLFTWSDCLKQHPQMLWFSRLDLVDEGEPNGLCGESLEEGVLARGVTLLAKPTVNGSPRFVRKCTKSWLTQGSSGMASYPSIPDNFSPLQTRPKYYPVLKLIKWNTRSFNA